MHLIFIILSVIAVLFLLVGVISPLEDKKHPGKTIPRKQAALIFGSLAVLFVILAAVTTPKPATHGVATTQPKLAVTPAATKPKSSTPTASLASLNAQVVPILTKQTDTYEQLFNSVITDAGQPNAGTYTSDFHKLWDDISHTVKYDTSTKSYNQASNLYFNANQTQPPVLDTWNTDIQQVYTDIQNYTQDQFNLFADQATNNSADKDQTKLTNDATTYQSDLAKAKVDIKQFN